MKCINCGSELKDDSKFCRECGQAVEYETEQLLDKSICPYCGNPLENSALFCNNCGNRIDSSTLDNTNKCSKCGRDLREGGIWF